jgi:hypothetical protein
MESLLELYITVEGALARGFIFGFVHVFLIIIGYYFGFSLNRFLKIVSNGAIAGIVGAALAHILADLIASIIDPTIRPMTLGIVSGGLIPLLLIPIFEKYVIKSANHIMVGDHEDIEKDLQQKHN